MGDVAATRAGGSADVEAAEEGRTNWSLLRLLDVVGIALVAVVVAQVVGAVVAGFDLSLPRNVAGITAGPLPNPFGNVPLYERLYEATTWADVVAGLFLLAGLGLIVLPRVLWEGGREDGYRRAARVGVVLAGVLGGVLAIAGGLGVAILFWRPGLPGSGGFQSQDTPLLVARLTALGMGALVAALAGLAVTNVEV